MKITDPMADMLTRIRNAVQARHPKVDVPASNVKAEIARVLKDEGYIKNYKMTKDGKQGVLRMYLKYMPDNQPAIRGLERVSRSGRRQYVSADGVPPVMNGMGIAILSTSKGVMTDRAARAANVGGEYLCRVW
ncbi:MAG: 30S ribosomal protein S8 [Thermodesulfobacteriota bacterium]